MTTLPQRIIIDTDVGTDDWFAILIFLWAAKLGKVKIEAITCTTGNTNVDYVATNVARLLEMVEDSEIPVYKGSLYPIIQPTIKLTPYRGVDGFGDLSYDHQPNMSVVKDLPSAVAMNQIVEKYPGQVIIIALAPLTNLALAAKLDRDFMPNLKDLWIMGGNYQGVGNAYGSGEFNFFMDPEAAYDLFKNSTKFPKLLPWETCLLSNLTKEYFFDDLGKIDNKAFQLLVKVEKKYYDPKSQKNWITCDAFMASTFLFPNQTILEETDAPASVELHGSQTRGQVVIYQHTEDYVPDEFKKPNIRIIEDLNFCFIKDLFLKVVEN